MSVQKTPKVQTLIFFGLVPLLAGILVILKVFYLKDCFAFDLNDDANHTFVHFKVVRDILAQGQLPLINIFNNFGTPFTGDLLTYPFGIHAWTYYILPDYLALTFNRFMLAALTVAAFTACYRRLMSLAAASICAVLTLWTPIFLWVFAHHHYQATLFFYAVLLLLQDKLIREEKLRFLIFFFFAFVLFLLSANIVGVILFIPFLAVHHFVAAARFRGKTFLATMGAVLAAFLLVFPDTLSFVSAIGGSSRVAEVYPAEFPSTVKGLLLHMAGQVNPGFGVHGNLYVSIPVVFMAGAGVWSLLGEKEKARRRLALTALILGFLPLLLVPFLMRFQEIYHRILLLRSVDITRLWWASTPFLMIGVGAGMDALAGLRLRAKVVLLMTGLLAVVMVLYRFGIHWARFGEVYRVPVYLLFIGLVLYLNVKNRAGAGASRAVRPMMFSFFALVLLGAAFPAFAGITGLLDLHQCRKASHHFSEKSDKGAMFPKLLTLMEPGSRFAAEYHSSRGVDLRAPLYGFHGSAGRSVLLSRQLAERFFRDNLIFDDGTPLTYHFHRPWNSEKYAELGIRYIIPIDIVDPEGVYTFLKNQGWKLRGREGISSLWENPYYDGMIFLQTERGRFPVTDFDVIGNHIRVTLPPVKSPQKLVATFHSLPGWKAEVDGREREIESGEGEMILVEIRPGEKTLWLRYQPYRWYDFLFWMILSLVLFCLVCYGWLKGQLKSKQ